ncbi:MAG: hypothetical protein EPN88_06380 [Bacteroidetes bacterium]|nr:MAG: hypothetical protein EPN88_06380 [Bacteroidota bacterium]
MKKTIFLGIILVSFIGCKKEITSDFSSSLTGEWSWISSCGGIAGICYTPISTNQKRYIVFTADSMFNTYINDTLKSSTKFQTYVLPPSDMPGTPNVIKYNSSSQVKFSIIHDTLHLDDFCCDGFYSTYKRIK